MAILKIRETVNSLMSKFECWWPECDYHTNSRSKIDYHHVTPKEVNPHRTNKSTIPLCKTHHALIFHPQATAGQHSIKTEASLVILGVYDGTNGKAVHYESASGDSMFYHIRTKEISRD